MKITSSLDKFHTSRYLIYFSLLLSYILFRLMKLVLKLHTVLISNSVHCLCDNDLKFTKNKFVNTVSLLNNLKLTTENLHAQDVILNVCVNHPILSFFVNLIAFGNYGNYVKKKSFYLVAIYAI